MGMSASQVRFLSLQSRRSHIGRELMTLSNRKMALSRDMNKASRYFTNAMNNIKLKWTNNNGESYADVNYNLLMKPNDFISETPYIICNSNGNVIVDNVPALVGYDSTTGKYTTLTDRKISDNCPIESLRGKDLTYENIAKWITQTTAFDGSSGIVSINSNGQFVGSSNPNAYLVPEKAEQYGFDNKLRYQIFEELGLVGAGTTRAYNSELAHYYGSQAAQEFGNYTELLERFLAANGGLPGGTLTDLNGKKLIGDDQRYSTYFGTYTGSGYEGGCLLGNLALAQSAAVEYEDWCKELKTFNLGEDTRLEFQAVGGKSHTFTVPAFLDFNSNGDGSAHIENISQTQISDDLRILLAEDCDANDNGTDISNTKVKYDTFRELYLNNGWIDANVTPIEEVKYFISLIDSTFTKGSGYSNNETGETWQFAPESELADQTVRVTEHDGSEVYMNVCEAAKRYAMEQTTAFYTEVLGRGDMYEYDTGSSTENGGHTITAANKVENEHPDLVGYNGVFSHTEEPTWWEEVTNFFVGSLSSIAALMPEVMITDTFGFTNLGDFTLDKLETAFYGEDMKGYTFNIANVEKSYYTFYEMYMKAYQDMGVNLLNNANAAIQSDTAGKVEYTYKDDQLVKILNLAGLTQNPVHMTNEAESKIYDIHSTDTIYDTAVDFSTCKLKVDERYTYNDSEKIGPVNCNGPKDVYVEWTETVKEYATIEVNTTSTKTESWSTKFDATSHYDTTITDTLYTTADSFKFEGQAGYSVIDTKVNSTIWDSAQTVTNTSIEDNNYTTNGGYLYLSKEDIYTTELITQVDTNPPKNTYPEGYTCNQKFDTDGITPLTNSDGETLYDYEYSQSKYDKTNYYYSHIDKILYDFEYTHTYTVSHLTNRDLVAEHVIPADVYGGYHYSAVDSYITNGDSVEALCSGTHLVTENNAQPSYTEGGHVFDTITGTQTKADANGIIQHYTTYQREYDVVKTFHDFGYRNNGQTTYVDPVTGDYYRKLDENGYKTHCDIHGVPTLVDAIFEGKRYTWYDTHVDTELYAIKGDTDITPEEFLSYSDSYRIYEETDGRLYYYADDRTVTDRMKYYLFDMCDDNEKANSGEDYRIYIQRDIDGDTTLDDLYLSGNNRLSTVGCKYYIAKSVVDEVSTNPDGSHIYENRKWMDNPLHLTFKSHFVGHPDEEEVIRYQTTLIEYSHLDMKGGTAVDYLSLDEYTQTDRDGCHLYGYYYDSNNDTDFEYLNSDLTCGDKMVKYRSQIQNFYKAINPDATVPSEYETDENGEIISTYTKCYFQTNDFAKLPKNGEEEFKKINFGDDKLVSGYFVDKYKWDENGNVIGKTRAYFLEDMQTHKDTGNDSAADVYFNRIIAITDARGNIQYRYFCDTLDKNGDLQNREEVFLNRTENSTGHSYRDLAVKVDGSRYTNKVSAYITPSEDFREELQRDISNVYADIAAQELKMKNFFGEHEKRLMDYYDAIFKNIAENGWVGDTSVNHSTDLQKAGNYLNNKLQNNEYFIIECEKKDDLPGYRYTRRQATGVANIRQTHDEEAENAIYAEYESRKKAIQSKEEAIDLRMAKLETEQEAITEEMESVKKMRDKNIDRYFKIFG